MKITNIYLERGVICMKVEGHPYTVLIDNHVDNRALLKAFEASKKPQPSNIERKFIEEEIREMEMNEADYWDNDDTHHLLHGC
jgi:hypothetical protein